MANFGSSSPARSSNPRYESDSSDRGGGLGSHSGGSSYGSIQSALPTTLPLPPLPPSLLNPLHHRSDSPLIPSSSPSLLSRCSPLTLTLSSLTFLLILLPTSILTYPNSLIYLMTDQSPPFPFYESRLLNDDDSNEHSLNYYNSNNRNDDRLNKPIRTGTFYTNLLIFQSDLQSTSYPIISDYYKTTFTSSSISIENSLQHPPKIETEPFYSQTSQFSNPFTLKCPNRGEFNTKDHTSLSVTVSIKSEECEIETSIVLGSVFYTVKLKGDYIIEGGEFKSLGEGFFKADSFIVYSTSGELSGGDTILRIFPNLEETTTDYLIGEIQDHIVLFNSLTNTALRPNP